MELELNKRQLHLLTVLAERLDESGHPEDPDEAAYALALGSVIERGLQALTADGVLPPPEWGKPYYVRTHAPRLIGFYKPDSVAD